MLAFGRIIKSNSLNTPMGVQIGFLAIKSNLKSNQGFENFSNQTSNQITVPKNLSNQTTNQIRLLKLSSNQISNQTTSQQTWSNQISNQIAATKFLSNQISNRPKKCSNQISNQASVEVDMPVGLLEHP